MKNHFKRDHCKQCGELLKLFSKISCCNIDCYNQYVKLVNGDVD